MKKEEIIEAILNRISDPYTDNEEDIAFCNPIELPYATEWLAEIRQEDIDNANDGEFRMPNAATPELLMEAFNCRVRLARRNVTIQRLSEKLTDHDETALYSSYRGDMIEAGYVSDRFDVIPIEFLGDEVEFFFDEKLSALDMVLIGKNSTLFNPDDNYCYYDRETKTLYSTNNPFEDGTLDAVAFATYIIDTPDLLAVYIDGYLDDDEIKHVFEYIFDTAYHETAAVLKGKE